MMRWNHRLPEMLRRFSIKNLLVLLLCLTASASGCHHKQIEASDFTLGDWMILLCEKAGIQQYEQQEPWFANVTDSMACFEAVQAAAEWDILKADIPFPFDQPTDRQWVAYTLAGLLGREESSDCKADDTADCFAADEISLRLMKSVFDGFPVRRGRRTLRIHSK